MQNVAPKIKIHLQFFEKVLLNKTENVVLPSKTTIKVTQLTNFYENPDNLLLKLRSYDQSLMKILIPFITDLIFVRHIKVSYEY